jgi:hypothetical protein
MFINVFIYMFRFDLKVKVVFCISYFELFVNIFVLKSYNKRYD